MIDFQMEGLFLLGPSVEIFWEFLFKPNGFGRNLRLVILWFWFYLHKINLLQYFNSWFLGLNLILFFCYKIYLFIYFNS
jgi:hypothetical protein